MIYYNIQKIIYGISKQSLFSSYNNPANFDINTFSLSYRYTYRVLLLLLQEHKSIDTIQNLYIFYFSNEKKPTNKITVVTILSSIIRKKIVGRNS